MPRYFFNLSFGQRVVPDNEGVDPPNRSAARDEALAVIRDLANPKIGSNSRRWASWFLEVADDGGQFARLPIGHPALEIVRPDSPALRTQEGEVNERPPARRGKEMAKLFCQLEESRQHTRRLVERAQELHSQLSSLCAVSKNLRMRSRRAVEDARLVGAGSR